MDFFYFLGLFDALFILTCVTILLLADSDIVTFIVERYGKSADIEFKDKVIWITGVAEGIGEALANELAKNGAKLILSARRHEELERVKVVCLEKCPNMKDSDILILPFDPVDLKSHKHALEQIKHKFGKVDVFISNAERFEKDNSVDSELQVDRELFELNVFSVMKMNRLVVQHFLENGGGQIGVVSAIYNEDAGPYVASYAASKHAVKGYVNTLRMETYGKNIDVTLISPRSIYSDAGAKAGDGEMLPERFAQLALVALANRINESWIGLRPTVPAAYFVYYFPLLSAFLMRSLGTKSPTKKGEIKIKD